MGQIVIMKDKIEVQVIDTPDYTTLLNEVDSAFNKNTEIENLAQEVARINCDNIIDQIIAYVVMTMRPMLPILKHARRPDVKYGCLRVIAHTDCFEFSICTCTKEINIRIFDDNIKYTLDERKDFTPLILSLVTSEWPKFKEALDSECKYAAAYTKKLLEQSQKDNERYINDISNFEL